MRTLALLVLTLPLVSQVPDAAAVAKATAAQRAKALDLVSLDVRGSNLADVVAELRRLTGRKLPLLANDPSTPVTMKVDAQPLRMALRRMGLRLTDAGGLTDFPISGSFVDAPGATVRLRIRPGARPSAKDPETLGTVLLARLTSGEHCTAEIERLLVRRQGKPVPLEECPAHSPTKTLALTRSTDGLKVRVVGQTAWECLLPVKLTSLEDGKTWSIGDCELTLAWPSLKVHAPKGMRSGVFIDGGGPVEGVTVQWKPGAVKRKLTLSAMSDYIGMGGAAGSVRRERLWCGCRGTMGRAGLIGPSIRKRMEVILFDSDDPPDLADIESISFTFGLSVIERWDETVTLE